MVDDNRLMFKVEQEIANVLINNLEKGNIEVSRAVEIAKFVVASIPDDINDQQMLKIIPILDDDFTELSSVVSKYLNLADEEEKRVGLEKVRKDLMKYIQNKNE